MRNAEALDASVNPARDTLERYLQIDMSRLMSWLRRGAKAIALCALAGFLLGAGYAMLAKPRYTVTTDILIDPMGLQIVSDDLFRQDGQQRDSALLSVESKRQTLLSRSVLLKVVQTLNLQRDPEFVPPTSWTSLLSPRALFGSGGAAQTPEIIALESLARRVSARRDELSFVIIMSVWTDNAEKSILISDAIVRIFKEELVGADSEGARRTAGALTSRLAELKAEVSDAEQAVEEFRRKYGLQSSQGELVRSRSMTQINQQLVQARERVIEAQSRYDDLTSSTSTDAAAMQSQTISSLRTQYATLKSRADADSQIYGPRHPRVAQAQIELRTLQNEIEAEKKRIVQAAKNNLDQAKTVVAALDADASSVSSEVFTDNDAQVRLRDLTREAAAKTAIYEAFLVRARQVTERQDLDTTNIRVISEPVPPKSRSWPPRTVQVAGFGALAGLVVGVMGVLGRGIWREMGGAPSRLPAPRPIVVEVGSKREEDDELRATSPEPQAEGISRRRSGSLLNLRSNSLLMHAGDSRH
jgi:succinoglycan biosynthesis transport protein ExoP